MNERIHYPLTCLSFSCLRPLHSPVNWSPLKAVLFYQPFLLLSSFSPKKTAPVHVELCLPVLPILCFGFICVFYITYIYLPLVSQGIKWGNFEFKNSAPVFKKAPVLCVIHSEMLKSNFPLIRSQEPEEPGQDRWSEIASFLINQA